MPITWKLKRKPVDPVTDDTVPADEMETLAPVEQMEMIERMAEAMPIDIFPPVSLRKAGEAKEFNIEDWKKRTGYKPA